MIDIQHFLISNKNICNLNFGSQMGGFLTKIFPSFFPFLVPKNFFNVFI